MTIAYVYFHKYYGNFHLRSFTSNIEMQAARTSETSAAQHTHVRQNPKYRIYVNIVANGVNSVLI
jgi:hypothetical protein